MLRKVFVASAKPLAPALSAGLRTSTALQAAPSVASTSPALTQLQGVLGLSSDQVQAVLDRAPELAREKPSVLQERFEFLGCGLGLSATRLRSLIVEKPALLTDLNLRELRSMAGLSS